jgi:tripartite-type tricarboxylate transporter receptor subunit TctC
MSELGLPSLAPVYFGFVAPAGTSPEIVKKLHDELVRIGNAPAFRQTRLIDNGLVPVFDAPAEFAQYLKLQRERSRRLIEESGFQVR